MALLGKRYKCTKCNTTILCTKAGQGQPKCCDQPMQEVEQDRIAPSD